MSCQSRQVEQQADGRFVEDRTYKVLIVDSVMNLFSQSAYGRGTGAELIYVQDKITLVEENYPNVNRSAPRPAFAKNKLIYRNSINSSLDFRSFLRSSTSLFCLPIKFKQIQG